MVSYRTFLINNGINNSYIYDIKMNDQFNSHRYYYLVFTSYDYEFFYIKSINLFLQKLENKKSRLIELSSLQKEKILFNIKKIEINKNKKGFINKNKKYEYDVISTLLDYDKNILKKIETKNNNKKDFNR